MRAELSYEEQINQRYEQLPLLTPESIGAGECIIARSEEQVNQWLQVQYTYGALALSQPAWMIEYQTKKNNWHESTQLSTAQLARLLQWRMQGAPRGSQNPDFFELEPPYEDFDIKVRSLELMLRDFPNLALYRGSEFESSGAHFSFFIWNCLEMFLFGSGNYDYRMPELVVLPVAELVRAYRSGQVRIGYDAFAHPNLTINFLGSSLYAAPAVMASNHARPPKMAKSQQGEWIAEFENALMARKDLVEVDRLFERVATRYQ